MKCRLAEDGSRAEEKRLQAGENQSEARGPVEDQRAGSNGLRVPGLFRVAARANLM